MTDTPHTAAQGFNFDAFMYGVRRDSPFDGSTLADSISNDEVRRAESAFNSLLKRAEKAEAELAALKGEQVPVALVDERQGSGGFCLTQHGRRLSHKHGTELFTAPQKPVVLPQAYGLDCFDQLVERNDEDGFLFYKCEVIDAIEAAGGIVKDGE